MALNYWCRSRPAHLTLSNRRTGWRKAVAYRSQKIRQYSTYTSSWHIIIGKSLIMTRHSSYVSSHLYNNLSKSYRLIIGLQSKKKSFSEIQKEGSFLHSCQIATRFDWVGAVTAKKLKHYDTLIRSRTSAARVSKASFYNCDRVAFEFRRSVSATWSLKLSTQQLWQLIWMVVLIWRRPVKIFASRVSHLWTWCRRKCLKQAMQEGKTVRVFTNNTLNPPHQL